MENRAERAHGYREEAKKHAKLAKSGQLDISNVHRTIAERYAWMAENLERRESHSHDNCASRQARIGGRRPARAITGGEDAAAPII
jgi:hypothetical protein